MYASGAALLAALAKIGLTRTVHHSHLLPVFSPSFMRVGHDTPRVTRAIPQTRHPIHQPTLRLMSTPRILPLLFLALSLATQATTTERCDCDSEVRDSIDAYDALLTFTASQKTSLESKHFVWGRPVPPSTATGEHLLHVKDYLIWHDDDLRGPIWVAYKLTKSNLNANRERLECFRKDPRLPDTAAGTCADYDEDTFDRGHMVPNSDMERSESAMLNTYFFSNMTPQYSNFNRGIWLRLEGMVRDWVRTKGTLYVITGAVFDKDADGMRDSDSSANRVSPLNRVAIPTHYYKIIVKKRTVGASESIAILLPHNNTKQPNGQYRTYLADHIKTIDEIESLTGIDFFPTLDPAKETVLEGSAAPALWATN